MNTLARPPDRTSSPGPVFHTPRFVHLRVHTAYSLLEGALRIKELPELCKNNAMPALGISDSGNLFGALEFSEALSGAGIQPLMGITLTLFLERTDAGSDNERGRADGCLALLAQNATGYANLSRLSSKAFLETKATHEPHITLPDLQAHSAGLLCLTGGPGGVVNRLLVAGQHEEAGNILRMLKDLFGDRLYVELQRHGLEEEIVAEGPLVDLAYRNALPLVATNEAYFSAAHQFEAHDALICISEGTYVGEQDRRRLTPEHGFKSQEDMIALFEDLPEAIENTLEIARRCSFRPLLREPILPKFDAGKDSSEAGELCRLAREGLKARLAVIPQAADADTYWERLEFELDVIIRMNFPGYFLIVADFIQWAKQKGIPVGPGRGSGAGSLVAYALTITDLDPLRFGLLFERFLNPERVSMPDFDIDFCQERRDEVIRYVRDKYGHNRVAQIITFGKLQARAVLRDVGRVLQMPYSQVDRLCKLVPNNPANPVSLEEAIEGEPKLQEAASDDASVMHLLEIGKQLEGLYRHASTHAAGVVIADRALEELTPLYRDPRSDMPVTQFNMKWVESAGLVKFDFLGLKTLTVLASAVELLARRNIHLDLEQIPLDDEATFALLGRGDTVGVFQFEGSGMRDTLRKMKPDTLEDLIALVALYRPGPMDNIPKYIACKTGIETSDYLHESLKPILEETYGVIIYQEQVMQIAQTLSGYSLGEADLLRRAMGKKIQSEMDKQKVRFIEGAVVKGVDRACADHVFELVNKFAGYGFNKSHAAAYAYIACQTAWLKANYPVEFIAASMSLDINNTDKLNIFRQDAVRLGIKLRQPDVNASEASFSVADGEILYALGAIRNVGRQAMEELAENRRQNGPFRSIFDFARRMNPRQINKRTLENLIRAGALDSLHPDRAQLLGSVNLLISMANEAASERESGQDNFFGEEVDISEPARLPVVRSWTPVERLNEEFMAVGFYLSGHPLDDYSATLTYAHVVSCEDLGNSGKQTGFVAGVVLARRDRRSQRGAPYAIVTLSDATSQFDVRIFSEVLGKAEGLLEPGQIVVVGVLMDREGDELQFIAKTVRSLKTLSSSVSSGLKIFLDGPGPLPAIRQHLSDKGKGPVSLVLQVSELKEVELRLSGGYRITADTRGAIRSLDGVIAVEDMASLQK